MTPDAPAAVLFDMDGTLIDSEHQWLRAETAVMARHGATWTAEDQLTCLGGPLERVGEYMVAKLRSSAVTSQMLQMEVLATMEDLLRSEPLTWQPGARELVRDALDHGIPTALVTASWRALIDAVHMVMTEDIGEDPFTVIVGGDEVANPKPHPDPYLVAAASLAVDAVDCLAIEDSPTGVTAALQARCRVIAVPQLLDVPIAGNVRVVESLRGQTVASLWRLHAD